MNSNEQDIFFSLLRLSLWEREEDMQIFHRLLELNPVSWSNVLQAFVDHALLGVVANTILSLPEAEQPNEKQNAFIIQYVANLCQKHFQIQQVIVEVFERLEAAGCKPILLKGEGLAQLYPSHCVRACGDVDVYVGKKDFDKAVACMQSICDAKDIEHAKFGNHDYSVSYRGILFEVHFTPGYASVEKAEQRFQELATEWLVHERCESINILGKKILVPAAQYNLLYNFEHLSRHYRNSELGIRQFVDWAVLLDKLYFSEVVLKQHLEELQVLEAWQRMAGVLQVALCVEQIPLVEQLSNHRSNNILKVVMSRGNFAQQNTELESKGGIFYIFSLFKKSREIALVFSDYSRKWLLIQLKKSFLSFAN